MGVERALLLTDVVDSTKIAERLGDAGTAALWARHDRLARDLLVGHRGREIDKTDGFLLLFGSAADAVAYAVAYHRAIATIGVRARAGLHVGSVILVENRPEDVALGAKPLEVEGVAKPLAARVMSVATGGQTLLTEAARRALGESPHRIVSHGHWRMKGLREPAELFEVGDDDAPFTPPPDGAKVYRVVPQGDGVWLPVQEVPRNLPSERDAFVGRDADLRALAQRFEDGARLVTVIGIGGTGKTRFVTRFAWTWLGDWPGGSWFCDLSEARNVEGIAYAVARTFDVPLGKGDFVAQLGHAIAGRGRCLVVLDNFEQVAEHAGETLGRWLDRAGEATFLVTSRAVLGLPGESTLALPTLDEAEAVALFAARAVQAKPDFALSDADRPAVADLVRLLDGLPLAIELAAARVRVMAPKTLLQRMTERFKLLASAGGRTSRQATLKATLDWSWDLLSADERAALAQLSVFEGAFPLEAAEGVLDLGGAWAVDVLQGLVDKSLVRRLAEDRFDLLVSVQEYAAPKLGDGGAAEVRHGAWYARYGTEEALDTPDARGVPQAASHLGNVLVACRRAIARGDGDVAVATLQAAWDVLWMRGPVSLGAELAAAVAAMPSLSPRHRCIVSRVLGATAKLNGRAADARAHHEQAIRLAREVGDARTEVLSLGALGNLDAEQGRPADALPRYEAGIAAARRAGYRRLEAIQLGNVGILFGETGRSVEAREHYEAALAVSREVGDLRNEGHVLSNLGILHRLQGRPEEARAHAEAALRLAREVGDRRNEAVVLNGLGVQARQQGDVEEARICYEAALKVTREVGDIRLQAYALGSLGILEASQGRRAEARAKVEAAVGMAAEVGDRRFHGFCLANLGDLEAERGDRDRARRCFEEGEALLRAAGDPAVLSEVLCRRARFLHGDGQGDLARALVEEADGLLESAGLGPDTQLRRFAAEVRGVVASG
jgi:predicted ATPase/class 3 adenylate cyclase/Flp pilus assembly protein TadD